MANDTLPYKIPANPYFMENTTSNAVGPIIYSAADFRGYTASYHRMDGVLGTAMFWVSQAANVTFAVTVQAGSAQLGGYVVRLPTAVTVDLPFVHQPAVTCTHKLYLVIHDEAYNAQARGYEAQIVAVESVNGSVPAPPSDATFALELATITYTPTQQNVQDKDIKNTFVHGGRSGSWELVWQMLTYPPYQSANAAIGTSPLRCQVDYGTVRFTGSIKRSDGKPFTANTQATIGQLTAGLRPKYPRYLIGATSNSTTNTNTGGLPPMSYRLQINPDGAMYVTLPDYNAPLYLHFDGISYELD